MSPGILKARLLPAVLRQISRGRGRELAGWCACLCCKVFYWEHATRFSGTGAVPAGCSVLPFLVSCEPDFLPLHICFPHLLPPAPGRV